MKRPVLAFLAPLLVGVLSLVATLALYPFVHFARPNSLWWLAGLVVYAFIWSWQAYNRYRVQSQLLHFAAAKRHVPTWSPRRSAIRFSLLSLACYALILASAQPQWGERTRNIQRKGTDIAIVLDASRSMLAEDVGPNRLRAATGELNRLLQKLDGDRVGLVVFAGITFTQSPLTSDYGAIRLYLDRVNPHAIPAQGTALGLAIQEAHRLLSGGDDPAFKRAPHQIILVISDGEDHETNPIEAAQAAQEDGIHVYTVGVGTSTGGRIPLYGKSGTVERYLTDQNNQLVITRLHDEQLHDIALTGDGAYTHYDGSGSTVEPVLHKIQSYDKAYLSSVMRTHYVNRGGFFLLPALLLLFLALLIPERPTMRPHRRWWQVLVCIICVNMLGGCDFKREDPRVKNAIELAHQGDFETALQEMDRTSQETKNQDAYLFNRGRMYDGNKNPQAAQDDFLASLSSSKESLRAASLIGVGNTLVQQKKYREAITRYERALQLNPSNDIARHNLEIAHRLLYPSCKSLDDPFEPNDNKRQAKLLPPDVYDGPYKQLYQQWTDQQLQKNPELAMPEEYLHKDEEDAKKKKTSMIMCGENQDWFLLPLQGGEQGDVTVKFRRLREDNGGPPLPSRIPPSSVRIAIMNAQNIVSAVDQGLNKESNEATVSAKLLTRHIDLDGASQKNGPWFLVVSADDGMEYTYDINVRITPLCSALEDEFEPNNSPADAFEIEAGEHTAQLCQKNDDWYRMDMDAGDNLFVDIEAAPVEAMEDTRMKSAFSTTTPTPPFNRQKENGRIQFASGEALTAQTARWGLSTQNNVENPYHMKVFHFAACPEGNDRFEPNERPSDATQLTAEQNELRYLRLCPEDQDWFVMQLPQEEKKKAANDDKKQEPETKAFSALVETLDPDARVLIELWSPTTGRRLAVSQNIVDVTPTSQPDAEDAEDTTNEPPPYPGMTGAIAATELPADADIILVRVLGDATFYHLSFPDTQPPEQSDSQSDSSDQDNNQDQDQNQEQEQSQDEQQQDQDSNADQEDEQEQNESDQDQDAQTQQPEQADEDTQPQEAPLASPEDEDVQRQALKQLLESLGNDDVNLQLQQAIEGAPPTQTQNPW